MFGCLFVVLLFLQSFFVFLFFFMLFFYPNVFICIKEGCDRDGQTRGQTGLYNQRQEQRQTGGKTWRTNKKVTHLSWYNLRGLKHWFVKNFFEALSFVFSTSLSLKLYLFCVWTVSNMEVLLVASVTGLKRGLWSLTTQINAQLPDLLKPKWLSCSTVH